VLDIIIFSPKNNIIISEFNERRDTMSNTLVVLKGLPGAGKTHFLKTKGLDVYSISPDQVRNLIAAPL